MRFMVHVIYGLRAEGHTLWLQSTGRRAVENFEQACENENVLSKKIFFFFKKCEQIIIAWKKFIVVGRIRTCAGRPQWISSPSP